MRRLTLNTLLSFAQFEREIAFSVLSVFSLRASDTSILPNFAFHRVGDSSTVEQRTLTPSILVRIQVPQPQILPISPRIFGFGNCWNYDEISVG